MIRALLLASLAGLVACTALDFSGSGGASSSGGNSSLGGMGSGANTASTGGASTGGGATTTGGGGTTSTTGGATSTSGGGGSGPLCPADDVPACDAPQTFDSNLPAGWTPTGVPVVIGGELQLPVPDSSIAYSRAETGTFTFDSCAVWVKLSQAETTAGYNTRLLVVRGGFGNQGTSGFYVVDGTLQLVGAVTDTIPYDPVAHRFLRLRQGAGQLFYEVSSDGDCWTTVGQGVADPSTATARLVLFPGTSFPGLSRFDDWCVPF